MVSSFIIHGNRFSTAFTLKHWKVLSSSSSSSSSLSLNWKHNFGISVPNSEPANYKYQSKLFFSSRTYFDQTLGPENKDVRRRGISTGKRCSHSGRGVLLKMANTKDNDQSNTRNSYDAIVVTVEEALSLFHEKEDVVFVDGSWHLDKTRSALSDYERGPRIKGARFLDIDGLNPHDNLPHMMPPYHVLQSFVETNILSSSRKDPVTIIVYGTPGTGKFTARAWYTLFSFASLYNQKKTTTTTTEQPFLTVRWMQGTLKEWQDQGGPIEDTPTTSWSYSPTNSDTENMDFSQMVSKQDVWNVIRNDGSIVDEKGTTTNVQLVDVRPTPRFLAEAPEPRPGLRLGHMPGAINLPFADCLAESSNYELLKSITELQQIFSDKNIPTDDDTIPVYVSCGSGVTASTVALALIASGRSPDTVHVYDGSWAEWGADPDTPIVV